MLTVINLYTIDRIFEEAEVKITPLAKMLYINCLMHHFRDKKPTVTSAVAFDLFMNDIPDYKRYEKLFEELHKGGLVIIGDTRVSFNNLWGRHIDRSMLEKVSAEEYVAGFQFKLASGFKDEMLKNGALTDVIKMKNGISQKQYEELLELFIKEQDAYDKKYSGYTDCVKHFSYWIPFNIKKSQSETIKSGSKILGKN
jgi:hypothetical protein